MMSHSDDRQADIIDAFNTTFRSLDNILKTFLDLHLSISKISFLPKFMINVTILILKYSISHF